MEQSKDLYFVAVKVFLEDGNGNLLITKDRFGDWDIPGGRLREGDFEVPLEQIAERKMKEELGESVQYRLEDPIVMMRHERDEILATGEREKRRIFAIGYRAQYLGGDIVLGTNHEKFEWVSVETFEPEKYFTGGWLNGVKEYQQKRISYDRI
jgi:ADP-ribose pyrophosphatase YjhB (NUDIX family)